MDRNALLFHGGDLPLWWWLIFAAGGLAVSIGIVIFCCLALRAYLDRRAQNKQ